MWRWKGKAIQNVGANQSDAMRIGRIVQYREDFYVIRYGSLGNINLNLNDCTEMFFA